MANLRRTQNLPPEYRDYLYPIGTRHTPKHRRPINYRVIIWVVLSVVSLVLIVTALVI